MYRFPLLSLYAVLMMSLATFAAATTILPLTDQALVQNAELILVGDAREVTTTWVDRDLVTLVTVEVDEVFKGEVGDTVEVALPGGVDTSGPVPLAVTWPGAPTLAPGDRAVLFLEDYGPLADAYAVSGWSLGKLDVGEGADGHEVVYGELIDSSTGDGGTESLSAFTARIRELMADGEAGR